MNLLITIYIFILGLVLGSFFNVVGLRVPLKQSVVRPASRCSGCGNTLKSIDLIPVVSWFLSRAKCRYCKTKVSWVYPLGELATGLLFLWMFLLFGYSWEMAIGLLLVSLTVIVFISDLTYMIIPNRVLLFFAPIFVVVRLLKPTDSIWQHLVGALVGGGLLLLVVIVSRGGMGMGDVKLFALLGWVLGFPQVLMALLVSLLLGTVAGAALLMTGVVKRKQPIPFGPFLAIGSLLAYAYGDGWMDWYLSLLQ